MNLANFRGSIKYVHSFMDRNGMLYRSVTGRSQENNRTPQTKCVEVAQYLNLLNSIASSTPLDLIMNFDETPYDFDMTGNKTVDFVGAKSIEVHTTGSDKVRFTLVVSIVANGLVLLAYVIWRGLKKVPAIFKTIPIPSNIVMTASESGTMNSVLMHDIINRVIKPYIVPILNKHNHEFKANLIFDEARQHITDAVLAKIKEEDANAI